MIADFPMLLDAIDVAVVVVDPNGIVVSANGALQRLVGDSVGTRFLELLPSHQRDVASARFNLMLGKLGPTATTDRVELLAADGRRVEVVLRAMPLWTDDSLVGVVGIAIPLTHVRACPANRDASTTLTPRQQEVLGLLAEGLDTETIAARLGVASETARNHVRGVLGRLDAHSRLEAVVAARRAGFL